MAATARGRLDTVLHPLRRHALTLPQGPGRGPSPAQREMPSCSSVPLAHIAIIPVDLERTPQEMGWTLCSDGRPGRWGHGGGFTLPTAAGRDERGAHGDDADGGFMRVLERV